MVLVLDAIISLLTAIMLIELVRLILILVLWTGCKFGCSVWWLVLCIVLIVYMLIQEGGVEHRIILG